MNLTIKAHCLWMNQANVMHRMVEMAQTIGPLSRDEAIATVVGLIGHLDMNSASYDLDRSGLLRLGVTIYRLTQAQA